MYFFALLLKVIIAVKVAHDPQGSFTVVDEIQRWSIGSSSR